MLSIQFNPNQVFDERKYLVDAVAKTYLRKATDEVQHLIPVEVVADGNCLYNSILLLMNTSMITTSELRVRTVIELVANGAYYSRMYSQFIGPLDIAIKAVCKNYTYSELYEIAALCNVLRCNIRSIYPKTDFREDMEILNNIFRPTSPIIDSCSITILWSHVLNEIDVRAQNNMAWSPNHFVPLMSPPAYDDSDNISHQSVSKVVTPEKITSKNNAPIQIRIPEFQSSPSRRRRSEHSNETGFVQSTATDAMRQAQNGIHEQRQSAMEQQIQPSQENLANETIEHRRIQLEKQKQRNQRNRSNETAEKRQTRLEQQKQRDQSNRSNEAAEERQTRLKKQKQRDQSNRSNEETEERLIRLKKKKERAQSGRMNETEEQRQVRLEKQGKRSQANRAKKIVAKSTSNKLNTQQQNSSTQLNEAEPNALWDTLGMHDLANNEDITKNKKTSISSAWPESISRKLKEDCLQKFLQKMSMPALSEATCAVCNVRSQTQKLKKLPVSKIPHIDLLKVPDTLKDFIRTSQTSAVQHADEHIGISENDNIIQRTRSTQSASTCNSSYVQYDNGIVLYVNGLFRQNTINMCTICQKCHDSLSKGNIPKFSPANNMWLGDIPPELQGLTIPEEKLISLYRHNSCVIKLYSPFHSATTAQAALKGNCITFLQSLPNIVNSLPLKLDDLCDTLKVIFVGAHPPERVHLKKILTVRKKKVTEALHWLKKNNILYQNVEINLHNINQLPEDDVPEAIMLTMEQKIGDEETSSERVGYVPDPLADPTESTNSDTIPISNSGVLDVNGSTVTSEEIKNYVLRKIKNDKATEQMDIESIYVIPHSSEPVNEYFNPKLLLGLYPTLFCYGYGSPEDKSRPVEIKLREHIRYLLSYNDRRFETNHSFIFVVFNLLQRRDACFHAQLIATKPYFQGSAQEIQSLNRNDIEMALNKSAKNTFSSTANASLHKLLNHIKTIGGRVMGSTYSRTALRTRIHALIYNQGLPSIFLTLNPADIHSPVALYFAGVKLDLDNIQIEQLMTTYKRAEIIASHPVATAKFFHLLITNILDTMIVGGVLGPIKAYFGTVENQGRGSLHLHLLIWLDHEFKPSDLKEKIQNADFREKLKAYLEDIIKEDLDEFKGKRTVENPDSTKIFNLFPM
ncbi:unnamed protein product [Rotaria sp. Silwood2]|nr:unnamed protein product [Rotaria sp. Silwood2]